jgi:hypothetical protein
VIVPHDEKGRAEAETRSPPPPSSPGSDAASIFAFLAGPLAWSIDLGLSYFLVPRAHASGSNAPLHLGTLVGVLVLAAGALAAARVLRRPRGAIVRGPAEDAARVAERARFLAAGGLAMQAFFLLVIVAMEIPKLLLGVHD